MRLYFRLSVTPIFLIILLIISLFFSEESKILYFEKTSYEFFASSIAFLVILYISVSLYFLKYKISRKLNKADLFGLFAGCCLSFLFVSLENESFIINFYFFCYSSIVFFSLMDISFYFHIIYLLKFNKYDKNSKISIKNNNSNIPLEQITEYLISTGKQLSDLTDEDYDLIEMINI